MIYSRSHEADGKGRATVRKQRVQQVQQALPEAGRLRDALFGTWGRYVSSSAGGWQRLESRECAGSWDQSSGSGTLIMNLARLRS
jgi:hypothetical protein